MECHQYTANDEEVYRESSEQINANISRQACGIDAVYFIEEACDDPDQSEDEEERCELIVGKSVH